MGYEVARYIVKSRHNTFIGYRVANDFSLGNNNYPTYNVAIGSCAGSGLRCCSQANVMIGNKATVNPFSGTYRVQGSVAIGNTAYVFRSASIALGSGAMACQPGDIVIGPGSRSANGIGNHSTVIGRGNSLGSSSLSGVIVLGACNADVRTTFVLGSPVHPLSARVDTTLTGQVSSLFVTINGVNRRIPILS
jgi:hypothetical protein